MPSTGLNDSWADFSPTTPNPAASNIPGAVLFAGSGPGRVGSRTLADSYYKAFGPRIGFAYQMNEKTVIRGGAGISYGAITSVTGSTHNMGFTLTQTFTNSNNGITPTFTLDQGLPPGPRRRSSILRFPMAPTSRGTRAMKPRVRRRISTSTSRSSASSAPAWSSKLPTTA